MKFFNLIIIQSQFLAYVSKAFKLIAVGLTAFESLSTLPRFFLWITTHSILWSHFEVVISSLEPPFCLNSLNLNLRDVRLEFEMRKPFDRLVDGLLLENNLRRKDLKSPISYPQFQIKHLRAPIHATASGCCCSSNVPQARPLRAFQPPL